MIFSKTSTMEIRFPSESDRQLMFSIQEYEHVYFLHFGIQNSC